jgi:hypothetical protein
LYALQISDRSHFGDRCDFFRIGFDASLGNDEPQEHVSWDAKDTHLGVELDVFCFKAFERDTEVINQIVDPFGFDYDIVNVGLYGWPDVFPEDVLHASLVRSPRVSEIE